LEFQTIELQPQQEAILVYWTGAAKSKDFFGGNAVETYNNSPDNHLTKLGDDVYGFEYNENLKKRDNVP